MNIYHEIKCMTSSVKHLLQYYIILGSIELPASSLSVITVAIVGADSIGIIMITITTTSTATSTATTAGTTAGTTALVLTPVGLTEK